MEGKEAGIGHGAGSSAWRHRAMARNAVIGRSFFI
jgi:hypothetical protein